MIYKRLDTIALSDLQNLIDNEVGESKTLEYKSELRLDSGDERREFLADITSFANADGGDLIFGFKESPETNLPSEIVGIEVENDDDLIRKIESILRDSVSPRVPDVNFKLLGCSEKRHVLITRIGASLLSPHRVTYKGYDKFFSRNAKGKYPMDVNELRTAFTMSHSLAQEIEKYKLERLAAIKLNQYRELEEGKPFFVFHSIPISSFRNTQTFEMKELIKNTQGMELNSFGYKPPQRVTIDGIKLSSTNPSVYVNCATAHYKTNGIVEKVTTDFFFPSYSPNSTTTPYNVIASKNLVEKLVELINELKRYYAAMNISLPILLSCAFINAHDFSFPKGGLHHRYYHRTIDRDLVMTPDIYLEDLSIDAEIILRPMLDSIWNACGYIACSAYNENGDYIGISESSQYF